MSVYEKKATGSLMSYMLAEQHLYGSSRLGMRNPNLEMIGAIANADTAKMYLGIKNYELSNHLGNVLTVISDKKIQMDVNNDNVVDYYVADIISASDYYPFGSVTPGRSFSSGSYRYAFNGKEKDDETKGSGNSYDYGERMYDSRLGRFLCLDKKQGKYPGFSPYSFAYNSPVFNIDGDGNDAIGYIGADGKLYIQATYYALSEGNNSFTTVEMKQLQSTYNNYWSSAKGMKVTMADGKEVEIGGVEIQVKPGGNFEQVSNHVKTEDGANALFKATGTYIKNRGSGDNTQAITTNDIEKTTLNVTFLDVDKVGQFAVGEDQKKINNAFIDESGHILGTRHPRKKLPGEKNSAYNKYRQDNYGDLERGNIGANDVLKLSQKDMQNIVNSKEFKLLPSDPSKPQTEENKNNNQNTQTPTNEKKDK